MKKYYVITPQYTSMSYGYEPPETGCDVVEVEANTKREAKVKGLRELRKLHYGWINWYRDTDSNPFTGLRAEEKID